ncbi:MAG TPA: hypothetical protein DCM87_10580 [Planctomycetes bacterium]|nr:hypothetical protein [Planctomycetota bacterium]
MKHEDSRTYRNAGIALALTGIGALILIVSLHSGPAAAPSALRGATAEAPQSPAIEAGATPGAPDTPATPGTPAGLASLEEHFGIQVDGVRLTAAGAALDFRYKIIDPERATLLADPRCEARLLDIARGAELGTSNPPQRRTAQKPSAGKTHFVLFANAGRLLKPGDKVRLVLGGLHADDLTIE